MEENTTEINGQGEPPAEDQTTMVDAIGEALGQEPPEEQQEQPENPEEQSAEQTQADDPYAIPDGLSNKAQERFRTLASKVRESEQQLTDARSQIDGFREVIRSTGATPQEFSDAIEYMRMIKSGDYDNALRVIESQRRMLAIATGRPLPGSDPLAQFPDLQQRVAAYQMDEQSALEVARYRMMESNAQASQHASQQQQMRQAQEVQIMQRAASEVAQMGDHWAKTDPDYSVKEGILMKRIPEIRVNFPPQLWAAQIKMMYESISAIPVQRPRQTQAPLRATGHSGGSKAPQNMLDVINEALDG